jgi:hypothetical protein
MEIRCPLTCAAGEVPSRNRRVGHMKLGASMSVRLMFGRLIDMIRYTAFSVLLPIQEFDPTGQGACIPEMSAILPMGRQRIPEGR